MSCLSPYVINRSLIRSVLMVPFKRQSLTTSAVLSGDSKTRLTPKGAVKLVKNLKPEERMLLMEAIKQREENKIGISESVPPPSWGELRLLAMHASLPFIGFGFLDNMIMIVAGEYIETSIGATFTISTMAAAALGNTLSDVFGVGSAWYVEHWAAKLGVNQPTLTLEQLDLSCSRIASNVGRALGVAIGCILGMFPLLFFIDEDERLAKEKDGKN